MSSLENILAFSQIEHYLTEEQKVSIASAMGTTVDDIRRRMDGKKKEDEFLLILLCLNICKNLSGFDEGVSKLGEKTYTPDLILELNNGIKLLLEIKHTKTDRYEISGGNLSERMEYAKSLNLPLYFAVSIKGFWMLFEAEYLKKRNGKIEVSDYDNSKLYDVFGIYSYLFPPNIEIRSVYAKNRDDGLGISHLEYGDLISYELKYNGRKIFRIKGKNNSKIVYSMILEALQDRLASINQTINKNNGFTVVIENDGGLKKQTDGVIGGFNVISEYEFLLAPIFHTFYHERGGRLEADGIIAALKEDKNIPRFQKEHIRGMMETLVDLGIPISYIKNNTIYKMNGSDA